MNIEKMAQLIQSKFIHFWQLWLKKGHSLNLLYHPRDGGNVKF